MKKLILLIIIGFTLSQCKKPTLNTIQLFNGIEFKLEGEEKKALELIFSKPAGKDTIHNTKLHKILISEGHNIAFASIRHHRAKACRCFTGAHGLLREKPKSIIKAS